MPRTLDANSPEHQASPTLCRCAQKCERALSWLCRAPLAQCWTDPEACNCWCHTKGDTEREDAKRRSIWWMKR